MNDERLLKCFRLVFPELSDAELTRASQASLASWDSVASLTLFSVLEEEFSLKLNPDDLEFFISFDLIKEFIKNEYVKPS